LTLIGHECLHGLRDALVHRLTQALLQRLAHVLGECIEHRDHLRVVVPILILIPALRHQRQHLRLGLCAGRGTQLHQRCERFRLVYGVGDVSLLRLRGIDLLGVNQPVAIPAVVAGTILDFFRC